MLKAGIEDPDSEEGKLFCAGSRDDKIKSQCPYDYCAVFEHQETAHQLKTKELIALVKNLRAHGVSREDIVLITGKCMRTVERYLKK